MGVNITQYIQAIGLFNGTKLVKTVCQVGISMLSLCLIICSIFVLLILLSNDIETNPGPPLSKLSKLSVCHSNIRGLSQSKIIAIETSLCDLYDVITLSETFLSNTSTHDLTLGGFHQVVRRDRETFGGGVAVYIRESITFKRLLEYEHDDLEMIWIELNIIEGEIIICTLYRAPWDNNFWDKLEENIEHVKSLCKTQNMLLLGDLNADFETINGRKLLDLCTQHNLHYCINEPTRITETSKSCLDQILINTPNFICESTVEPPVCNNDHCSVGIKLNFKVPCEYPYYREIWSYKDGDYDGFSSAVGSANWDECFISDDVDNVCESWTKKLLSIARAFITNKAVLIRPNDKPWYTNELRLLKRKAKRWYSKAKTTNKYAHWGKYKQLQSEYKSALDQAYLDYKSNLNGKLCENRNSKTWWRVVKKILGKGSTDSYPAIEHPVSKQLVHDNEEKATLFNNFFLSHSNIDLTNAELPNEDPSNEKNLSHIDVSETEVEDLVKNIDQNKASGPDGISPRILKEAGLSIVPSLTRLIKLSLQQCKVPMLWKRANVTPIHKKDDKDQLNNYRPISLLPVASKILERIVFKHVYNFLHENNFLTKHQSGFRPNDSTVNQLAYMYHEFCKALDDKKDVRIVFCDISKAFDRV